MLNVYYDQQIGWLEETATMSDGKQVTFHLGIYRANALFAIVYRDIDRDQLCGFALDVAHLKRQLKDKELFSSWNNFHFFAKDLSKDKELKKAVWAIMDAGKDVIISHEVAHPCYAEPVE